MKRDCLFICKRRTFAALFIVIVMCAASIHVMANNSVKAEEPVDEPVREETVRELQKLEGKLTVKNEAAERAGLQEAVEEQAAGKKNSVSLQEAYRVKLLKNFWLTGYLEGGELADHVSGKIQWKVPYQQHNGEAGIMTFALREHAYVRLGESSGEKQEQIPAPKKEIARIIAKAGITSEDIDKAEYYYSQMYSLVLIDIKTQDREFVIPYAEFPEKMKPADQGEQILNGQIYEISDFMNEMNQIFDEKYLQDHPEEVTGMYYRRDTMAKKKWVIVGIFGVIVLFFVVNTMTMKGYCYTVSYPGGEMIFLKNGKCYVGLPGSEKRSKLTGRSYDGRPTSLSDADEVEDTYSTFLGTIVSVDKGRWIGVHCINRYFLIQCSGYDKPDNKKFDFYQYILGKPYFVFKNNGEKDDYPQEFIEKSKESNLGLPVQK